MIVSQVKRGFLIFIYILYIYHISFVPLPYFLRTRLILGIIAIAFAAVTYKYNLVNKYILLVLLAIFLQIAPIIFTSFYNNVFDHWFLQNVFLQFFYLAAAYFVIKISYKILKNKLDFQGLVKTIVFAIVVQNIIATLMFLVPPVGDFLRAIQNQNELATGKMSKVLEFQSRFIGLGISVFFIGGVLCGYALILIGYLIRTAKNSTELIKYSIFFLFIFVTGLFIARTTLVGGMMGIAFIFWPKYSSRFKTRRVINPFILIGLLIILAIPIYFTVTYIWSSGLNTPSFNLAFELFINFFSGDGFTSQSTEHLKTMYVFPDNLKTWLIGDGKFADGSIYYKEVDVGYLRLIYYFGVIGTIFYLAPFMASMWSIWRLAKDFLTRRILLVSLVYLLVLNLKGMTDINYFMYLFLWFFIIKKSNYVQECNI